MGKLLVNKYLSLLLYLIPQIRDVNTIKDGVLIIVVVSVALLTCNKMATI